MSQTRTARHACQLCGLYLGRSRSPAEASRSICDGCLDRVEAELSAGLTETCPQCGRHRELCAVSPCRELGSSRPAPLASTDAAGQAHRRLSARSGGAESAQQQSADSDPVEVAWIPVGDIDPTPERLNSRRSYDGASLDELAASVREHGILQPLCVRPSGRRYVLVFGRRRLEAASRAGLQMIPCTIRLADDDRAFLLNAVENLHRHHLTGTERVRAIERLAGTNLGVREISRRTGFDPSTISRWLKINRRPRLKQALETEELDIGRLVILVDAPEEALPELLARAGTMRQEELRTDIARLKALRKATPSTASAHLVDALRLLRSVQALGPEDRDVLEQLRRHVDRLFAASAAPDASHLRLHSAPDEADDAEVATVRREGVAL